MLVSVIVPTHDRAGLLFETLATLERQSYRPLEIIVVDDGSADDTWQRLGAWADAPAGNPGQIRRRVHQGAAGAAAARNHGLAVAQGALVQYLDSDDRMSIDKLRHQVDLLAANPELDGAYCAWRSWFDGSLIRYGPRRQRMPIAREAMLLGILGGTWFLPAHAYLFRRELLGRVGPWNESLCYEEDAEFLLRILTAKAHLGYTSGCLADYRRHAASQVSRLKEHPHPTQRQMLRQSIDFRRRICAQLPATLRTQAETVVTALERRRHDESANERSPLVSFGRTAPGAWLRRRFGDGLLAWLDPTDRASPPTLTLRPGPTGMDRGWWWRLARRLSDHLPPWLTSRPAAGYYRRQLAALGPEAEPDLRVCLALLQPGATVVDLGANIGLYTLACARLVGPSGWVLALEPMPWAHAVLRHLTAASGYENLTLLQAAAAAADGRVWMSVPRDRSGLANHYLAHVTDRPDRQSVRVPARSLDGLLQSRPLDLLKIDVEGHEAPCLRGAMESIRRCRPALLVEIGGPAGVPTAAERSDVFDLLAGLGYEAFMLEGGRLRPWSEGLTGVNHWFLQHRHLERLHRQAPDLLPAPPLGRDPG